MSTFAGSSVINSDWIVMMSLAGLGNILNVLSSTKSVLELGGGNSTALMTCTTPLSATKSTTVTLASLTKTPSLLMVILTFAPFNDKSE